MSHMERKLSAILAADVAGYSRLMGLDEEGTLVPADRASPRRRRSKHRPEPRPHCQNHR